MGKSVDWNEEIAKIHKDYSDEGALKLYNDKYEESSRADTSLDKPNLKKKIFKAAFYALGGVAAFTSMCILGDNPSLAVQVPGVIAGLIGTATLFTRAGQSAIDTMNYPDRMKLWNKQQTENMKDMTEEEKNAYKIKYVKDDIDFRANSKVFGVDGFHKDAQDTLHLTAVSAATISLPAICAGGLALVFGKAAKEIVMDKISSIRKFISGDEPNTAPKNTI